jgi:anion transporter
MLIALLPTPTGLSRTAQLALAVIAVAVVLWMLRTISNGITSILMMGLLVAVGVRPALALSGFSAPSFWILLAVLFYGFAMQQTGLAKRVAFNILKLYPPTYTGILLAFLCIGSVLTLGIPSSTVRTAIMVPIAWAMVQSLGLEDRSRGSALIMLVTIEMAVVPGTAIRYGSLFGPVVDAVFLAKSLPLTWGSYARAMAVPTMLLCALVVFASKWAMRAEPLVNAKPGFARDHLAALGPISREEAITGALVLISIVFWSTDRYHHLPSFLIGMLVVPLLALVGIVREEHIGSAVSWNLLLFLGGAFGLANVVQELKITDWLAGYIVPMTQWLSFSPVLMLSVAAIAMFALRFLDPSGFIAIPVLFLPIVDVASSAGVPPLVLIAPLLLACAPFWLSYENVWVAMGDGITRGEAYSNGQRLRLANVYAAAVIVALVLSVGYWKLIGAL